jgi:hypothetical protein
LEAIRIICRGAFTDGPKKNSSAIRTISRKNERAYVKGWTEKGNKKSSDKNLTGIALSGGGIRSATFSLGVLQALARHDVLQYIDYISTVSGGGYIGSGLTWWLAGKSGSKETYGVDSATFPYGIDDPARPADNQTPILAHLRDNASYLVPGGGLSYLSGVAILIRAAFLNLLVWVPIGAAVWALLMMLGPVLSRCLSISIPNPQELVNLFPKPEDLKGVGYQLFYLLIWAGLFALGWFALACIDFAFFTRSNQDSPDDSKKNRLDPSSKNELSDAFIYGSVTRWFVSVALFVAIVLVGIICGKELWDLRSDGRPKFGLFVVTYSVIVVAGAAGLGVSWIVRRLWRKTNLGLFFYGDLYRWRSVRFHFLWP